MPTEMRTRPSSMPSAARSLRGMEACVITAGSSMSDSTPAEALGAGKHLERREKTLRALRGVPSRPAFDDEGDHAAGCFICRRGDGVLRGGSRGRGSTPAPPRGARPATRRSSRAFSAVPLHAHGQRLGAPQHEEAVEGRRHRAHGVLQEPQALVRARRRRSSSAPPTTSECPLRYFVDECTTAVAPSHSGRCSTGVAKVLSTTTGTPRGLRHARTRAAMSNTLSIGLVGVSSHTILVGPGGWPPRKRARSLMSTKVEVHAHGAHHLVEDAEGAAVHVVAAHHVVAGARACAGWRGGRAARAEGEPVLGALERGERRLRGCRAWGCGCGRTRSPCGRPGRRWAKVLDSTMGVITAPVTGSGCCPAWMARVSSFIDGASITVSRPPPTAKAPMRGALHRRQFSSAAEGFSDGPYGRARRQASGPG
jgi:hypothetical protein